MKVYFKNTGIVNNTGEKMEVWVKCECGKHEYVFIELPPKSAINGTIKISCQ